MRTKQRRGREHQAVAKGWKLVSLFDSRDYYYAGNIPTWNVPLRAKYSLLADMLRSGKFAGYNREQYRWETETRFDPLKLLKDRRNLARREKARSAFRGKLIGIEIEYYPEIEPRPGPFTVITGDGSLNCGGREIQKLTWVSRNGRLEGLLGLPLFGRIDRACGLHVHVDARHLGREGLLPAFETYNRLIEFSPFLKRLVPRSRLRNTYCRWVPNCLGGNRYSAINYAAFEEHGTIEFRCQGGTLNKVKIETWALLCRHLLNYAARPENVIPRTWATFVAILPEPLRSWAILRREVLYGSRAVLSERVIAGSI